jgi:hypothetical protein
MRFNSLHQMLQNDKSRKPPHAPAICHDKINKSDYIGIDCLVYLGREASAE